MDELNLPGGAGVAALLRFGSGIGLLNEPELYLHILDLIFELVPARHAAIMFASDDGNRFVRGIYRARGQEADATFVPAAKITYEVLTTGNAFSGNDDSPPALCALMKTSIRKLGVIYAEAPLMEAGFAGKHLQYMEGIAGLASGVLRNAKSFEYGWTESQQQPIFTQPGFAADMNAHGVVGESPVIVRLFEQLRRAGPNDRYVLILGEPGTGKESAARAIHRNSPRAAGMCLPINCASIPNDMLEAQMFGHEKGAFTGAVNRRAGWVEIANGGTLFFDEIGDLPLALQPKLLRFLQEKEFMRLGGNEVLRSDVRIIAATNRDLHKMVKDGLFREDLLGRLEVFTVKLPPLRDRGGDIMKLAWYFIRKNADLRQTVVKEIAPQVERLFCECAWPGNVRQLENTIIHALGNGDAESAVLTLDDLPDRIRNPQMECGSGHESGTFRGGSDEVREDITKADVLRALSQTGGHCGEAAKLLDISRATFFRLKKKFGV
jgi:transcriptional regulator with PAS, ATPase and Fis domain